jgi:hypothetical protein
MNEYNKIKPIHYHSFHKKIKWNISIFLFFINKYK